MIIVVCRRGPPHPRGGATQLEGDLRVTGSRLVEMAVGMGTADEFVGFSFLPQLRSLE